jgi:hypothetical protein
MVLRLSSLTTPANVREFPPRVRLRSPEHAIRYATSRRHLAAAATTLGVLRRTW